MKVSILLPTLGTRIEELNRLFLSLSKQTSSSFELVLVSQSNHDVIESLLSNYKFEYRQVKINKKGLSHARNVGLKYISGDTLLLSDDDAWYPHDAVETILTNVKLSEKDILCFKIFDPLNEVHYKKYSTHKKNVTQRQILKKSSIEICFNLNKVKQEDISFDENFGLGTTFTSGEENLVLYKLKNLNYTIGYVDKTIVYHLKKEAIEIDLTFVITKSEICKKILGRFTGYVFVNLLMLKNFRKITKVSKIKAFKAIGYIFLK